MNGDYVFLIVAGMVVGIDFCRTVLFVRKSPETLRAMYDYKVAKRLRRRNVVRLRKVAKLKRHLDKWADTHLSNSIET